MGYLVMPICKTSASTKRVDKEIDDLQRGNS
jgi:hypothetical protein